MLPALSRVSQVLFYLAYPLIIYWSYTRLSTASVGLVLLALYGVTMLRHRRGVARDAWPLIRPHLPVIAFIAAATVSGERRLLLLHPAIVSLYLFTTFALTLRSGPPMYERFGRLYEPDFPDFLLPYCRRMTVVWCGFFLFNAAVVVALSRAAPIGWWTLYSGLLSYVLIGLLIAGEACFRRWWFRYYHETVLDRAFARLFPSEDTALGRRSLAYAARRREPRPQ